MRERLSKIRENAIEKVLSAKETKELEELKVALLGKKGELTAILKGMGSLTPEERPLIGQLANDVRSDIEKRIEDAKRLLLEKGLSARLESEAIDVTMPGIRLPNGHKHPMTIVTDEINDIFIGMGYEIAEGPEIELDYYNFEALNIPKHHPARDMQDTFYIKPGIVLRTHTSPVQIRVMEAQLPPVKIISPGSVYRCDHDVSHTPMFHQVEGLMVDKHVRFSDLKGILSVFIQEIFGANTRLRFRPSYFPFTEPSAEVDIGCVICEGAGCRVCKDTGWLEILGSGMVHPQVLRNVGYDPEEVSGFAFGMGVERIAMLRFGIDDIRQFYYNDIRFLSQF
ncbi:MAG TPA: phenylalanine--tRNA ligase subunit alpha [Syntrophorhabdus aromaticivorans]|nr:phenylalanine--tRNA ligase subunit alpha [Syntrophorhabdus aromaticivorans]